MLGGYDGHRKLNSIERYDPRQATAEFVANMKERRVGASAVTHNERIYVAGGYNGQHLDTVEMFVCTSILFSFPLISQVFT